MLLDVDFVISARLHQRLTADAAAYDALVYDTYHMKDLVVLPAFETKQGLSLGLGSAIAKRAVMGERGGGAAGLHITLFKIAWLSIS